MRNKGKKTIDETHPELAAEWDYDKNGELSPQQITSGSARDIWWKCENGHSFQLRVSVRTDGKTAPDYAPCPYCSHKRPTPGEYSLQTEYPELMEEWDWEANIAEGLDPDNLLPRSARKAHWVCKECGHHWASTCSLAGGVALLRRSICLPSATMILRLCLTTRWIIVRNISRSMICRSMISAR